DVGDLVVLLRYGDQQPDAHDLGLLLAALGGDRLIEDHEEGPPTPGRPLNAGTGDDVADADRLVGGDPVGEVGAHGGPELPLEAGRAEGQDPGDVGVEPAVVERSHGDRELTDEGDVVGGGVWEPTLPAERNDLEGQQGDQHQHDE